MSKLQKQVREMRKFMRGMVQLQIEQYEPATIMIQAWWRGCLVCSYELSPLPTSLLKKILIMILTNESIALIVSIGASGIEEANGVLMAQEPKEKR